MRKFILIISGIILFAAPPVPAQESEPYYTKHWSIALSPEPINGYYQITTFIPTRYLLFIEKRNDLRRIGSHDYLYAITQDDVPVLVLQQIVSEQPFRKSVGRHQVIFNCPYDLCRTEGCDRNDPEQLWQIVAGEAFEMINFEEEEVIKLRGTRINNNTLTGYININELHTLHRRGIITRTDVPHPHYQIQRTEVTNIGTDCSQIKSAGYEEPLGNQPELEKLVLEAFGIGRVINNRGKIVYEKGIGTKGEKVAFFVYDIENMRVVEKYKMIAVVTYLCRKKGISETPVRIEKVHLKNLMTEKEHFLDIKKYKSPKVLLDYLRSPYLFSVNTYQQYIDLIQRLGDEFEDRALAGYFLSEYNVSCRSIDRKRPEVQGYSYREH